MKRLKRILAVGIGLTLLCFVAAVSIDHRSSETWRQTQIKYGGYTFAADTNLQTKIKHYVASTAGPAQ